jgi:hypothetical protein
MIGELTPEQVEAARSAELAKLGPNAQARREAVTTYYAAVGGAEYAARRMARVFTAQDFLDHERDISRAARTAVTPPAVASTRQDGRVSQEVFDSMPAARRLDYARQFDQSQFQTADPGRRRP